MKRMSVTLRSLGSAQMAILFLLISAQFASAQTPEIDQAKYQVQVDQSAKAKDILQKAVAAHPEDASLWYFLGEVQIKRGELKEAEISFQKGIELNDKELLNTVGKGHLRLIENNAVEAKKLLEQAITLSKSKNIAVLKAAAEVYLTQTAYANNALALLLKAKAINNKDEEVFLLLGDAYLLQNNGGLAVTSLETAASLSPKDATPEYKIGLIYLRSKNTEAADVALTKAVKIDPAYTLAYKELGELYYLEKKAAEAVVAYERYLSLTENPEPAKLRYAFFLFMAKSYAKANEIFKTQIQKSDVSPLTLRFYAFSLFAVDDFAQTQTVMEQYFAKQPAAQIEASDYKFYGQLLMKLNQDSVAMEALETSYTLDTTQTEVLQTIAETQFKNKRYEKSINAYSRLMKKRAKPLKGDHFKIGQAYYITKQFGKADTTFQKLIELESNISVGYLWAARTKSQLDPDSEKGLAKPYYEKVIEKASANPEKEKNNLIEANSYLGYYHYLKGDLKLSKTYWESVIALDPNNEKAKEAIRALNEALKGPKPKQ
ncbi:MAG: tetratricopeptide repeat protein [Chryseolinea sp.]